MVWREMPVMRSISRWVEPPSSSVQMVVCRCGFKTFNLGLPQDKGAESNVLPVGPHGAQRTMLNASDHRGLGGAVWVAISGAYWVAAGGPLRPCCFPPEAIQRNGPCGPSRR